MAGRRDQIVIGPIDLTAISDVSKAPCALRAMAFCTNAKVRNLSLILHLFQD